ncbi:hypothetical protein J3Q64DRAFT_1839781 [Phycomyces blakesleeanus]|uniref:Uncharacterized protein n=2 Tax=Phycomyces blakesleeanus TaxID=4837 RepID=A0A162TZY6_PHYB8|nr:hypothetical protein PHYBLDRAFT_147718 [Phycomyces blakesleeanus NRRL 1555(-)]OAD71213.1 hypothetical protein PHYBLDRAFT_147718 [Phycomyces blakesleeanus NRRL 1555(-)]|eukprot:XP_018289253.1 hypothetical protein PHYBLDRAFT_147718 [Phycomyces blakesleeanus NRRL 1555(-)]
MNPSDTQETKNEPINITWEPSSWINSFSQSKGDSQSTPWNSTPSTPRLGNSSQNLTLSLSDLLSGNINKNTESTENKPKPETNTETSTNKLHVKNAPSLSGDTLIDTGDIDPTNSASNQLVTTKRRAAETGVDKITISFATLLDLDYGECDKHNAIKVDISLTDLILGEQSKVTQKLLASLASGETSSSTPFTYETRPDTQDAYFELDPAPNNTPSFLQPSLLDEPIVEDFVGFGVVKSISPIVSTKKNVFLSQESDSASSHSKLNPKASEFSFSFGTNKNNKSSEFDSPANNSTSQSDADETFCDQSDTFYFTSGSPLTATETEITYNIDSSKFNMENFTPLSKMSRSDTDPRESSVDASESDYAGLDTSTNTNDSMWNPRNLAKKSSLVNSNTQDLVTETLLSANTTKFNVNASEFKLNTPLFDFDIPKHSKNMSELNAIASAFNVNVSEFKPVKEEYNIFTQFKFDAPKFDMGFPKFRVDAPEFKVGAPEFKVGAPEFKVDVPEFKVDAPEFNLNAPEFNLKAPEFKVDASEFKLDAPEFKVDTPEFKVTTLKFNMDTPELKVNAPELKLDAPEFKIDTTEFSVDAPEFTINTTEFSVDAPEFTINTTEFSVDAPEFTINATEFSVDAPEFTINTTELNVDAPKSTTNPTLSTNGDNIESDKVSKEFNVNASELNTNAPEFNVCGFGLNVDIAPFDPVSNTAADRFSGPGIFSPTAKDPYDFSPEEYYDPSYLTNAPKNVQDTNDQNNHNHNDNNENYHHQTPHSSMATPEFSPTATSHKTTWDNKPFAWEN